VNPLPPIPSPPAQYWRLFQHNGLPVAFFVLVLAGVVFFWIENLRPNSFVGQVEVIQSEVKSADAGLLTNLWVIGFQEVKAGDLIAEITTTDPRTVNNRLEVMRDQMRLTALELDPMLTRQRSALEYEQLTIACARIRAELATARVNLIQASNEFRRVSELYQQKERLVSETDFDLAKAQFEALQTDVDEKSKIVIATQKTLDRLATMADAIVPGGENEWLRQALSMEEEKIKVFQERMKPLQLLAPIDGIVTLIHHRAGEQLIAGESIATITSKQSERIVGYLPPAFPVALKLGMAVEVRTRKFQRHKCAARVIGLGPHMESVTNALISPP
jgi:multidrug resistance efflux pump